MLASDRWFLGGTLSTYATSLHLVFTNEIPKDERSGLYNTEARDSVHADSRQDETLSPDPKVEGIIGVGGWDRQLVGLAVFLVEKYAAAGNHSVFDGVGFTDCVVAVFFHDV
jgi:hypothetical protein